MHTNADYLAADPLRPSDTQKLSTPTGNTTRGKASATEHSQSFRSSNNILNFCVESLGSNACVDVIIAAADP